MCAAVKLSAWMIHFDGALALLQRVGFQKTPSRLEYRVQVQLAFSGLVTCFQTGEDVPMPVSEWYAKTIKLNARKTIPLKVLSV